MPGYFYYRRLRSTGVWHILHTERTTPDELRARLANAEMREGWE